MCDFEDLLGLKQSTVSYHLKQLLDAGIIAREKRGSFAYFSVTPGALEHVRGLLVQPPRRSRPTSPRARAHATRPQRHRDGVAIVRVVQGALSPARSAGVGAQRRVGERAAGVELDPAAAPDLGPQHPPAALHARLHA